jgi:catechol 2,3-dioxygenase-like lactoylglutathione lyase family enzyme
MHGAKPAALPPSGLVAGLEAQDLAATRDFYVRDLGLTLGEEEAHRLVVRVGGATLEFRQHDGPAVAGGDLQLTFECEDPDGLLKRLRALGVEVDVRPAGAGSVRFVARDPDGRRVVFASRADAQ